MLMNYKSYLDKGEQERKLYADILAVSRAQIDLLNNHGDEPDMVDKLIKLIDERQQIMNNIDSLEAMGPEATADQVTTEHINEIRNIMLAIKQNDDLCRRLGQDRLNRIGDKLASTQEHKKAYNAYSPVDSQPSAWFFDQKK